MKHGRAALIAFAAVGALTTIIPVAPSGAVQDKCAHAQALYDAGYYVDAEKAYKRLLGHASCATTERVLAARERGASATKAAADVAAKAAAEASNPKKKLALAKRLQDAGFTDDADKIVKSVVQDSTQTPPVEIAQAKLAQAQRLRAAGFDAEARKLVESVAAGSTVPIPKDLQALDQREGWWQSTLATALPLVRSVAEIVVVVLAALLLVLLVLTLAGGLIGRLRQAARLEGFSGSDDTTLSPVLNAALGAVIGRLSDEGADRQILFQSGTEPKFEVPAAITEASPTVGIIAGLVAMLDKLMYKRMVVVSGTVHPADDARGAGVTLTLANRRGHVTEQITVWESEFDLKPPVGSIVKDSVRYEQLILPAAVWLGYQERFGYKVDKPPLQTRNWRSYALFALGELKPDNASCRRLYETALDRDPCNLGARLNLATLLLNRPDYAVPPVAAVPDDGSRETWSERLEEAGEHLCAVTRATSALNDPIWYRARYAQAARYIYLASGADANANAGLAISCLSEIATETTYHGDKPRFKALLTALAAPVAVLQRVATLIANGVPSPAVPDPSRWVSASAEYNAAGLWARWAAVAEVDVDRDLRTRKAVQHLRRAIERTGWGRDDARTDPDFDPIRDTPGFAAIMVEDPAPPVMADPERVAVTVDAGTSLFELAELYLPPAP